MPKEFEVIPGETFMQWWARVNDRMYDPTQDDGSLAEDMWR